MKKTNFVVAFWFILAIIAFVVILMNLYSLFNSLSYLIVPETQQDSYYSTANIKREMITSIPMLVISGITFYSSLKQGLKFYKELG